MTALEEAQLHLSKAREFLEAAEANRDRNLQNAATSNAIISAINSKDAICLSLTGRTNKSDNHGEAVSELTRAGRADLSPTLNRLLKLKARSQYAPLSVTPANANKAVEWAQRMLSGAQDVVAGR
jgi:hypothetical protein